MAQVMRREWVWVAVVSGLIVAASTVPYVAGYAAQTPQVRFGGALLDRADYHSYLARMWQGYRGEWEFRLLFTPESHDGVYFQPFYMALGHIARLLGTELSLMYQIARVVFGFLMLLGVYPLVTLFVEPVQTRRAAFLLATTASGLGWLTEAIARTPPGGVSPMDFWLLDGFVYLEVLLSPHFCAATGLLLLSLWLLLRRPSGPLWWEGGLAVIVSLGLGLIHPYTMLVVDLVSISYWAIRWLQTRQVAWRSVATAAAMGVVQLPLVIYELWTFRTHPVFSGWSVQNVTLSPPPRFYLFGYGVLLVLGTVGAVTWARRDGRKLSFPLLWIGLVVALTHLPWNLQRRFLEGVQVPLGMLAGVGLTERLLPEGGQKLRRLGRLLIVALVVALAAMSNLQLTTRLTLAAASLSAPVAFWPADLLAGIDWLGDNSGWDETVLSAFEVGNLIPARIGHRVVLGHGMETVDYDAKREAVARFYAARTTDAERRALVETWGVAYVVHGAEERALGDFDPDLAAWLELAFRSGEVAIYRVTLRAEP